MSLLEIIHVSKRFNGQPALEDVSLSLDRGRILSLLGPSGCGKTTLLRVIAGLERPDEGIIAFGGRDMGAVPPHKRRFRMMFQEFALFPHRNVFDNVAFGLEMQKRSRHEMIRRTAEMLALVGLEGFDQRDVASLSGGERQRVALARSLAPEPDVLMLDEPLGSLDRALRKRLLVDLNRILRQVGVTALFVTHDQSEAFAMADTVAVMNNGRVEQVDPPERLYRHPANPTVAEFLGFQNLMAGRVTRSGSIRTCIGEFPLNHTRCCAGDEVTILLRPEAARLADPNPTTPDEVTISGVVMVRLFQGHFYHITMKTVTGEILSWELPATTPPPPVGGVAAVAVNRRAIQVMP